MDRKKIVTISIVVSVISLVIVFVGERYLLGEGKIISGSPTGTMCEPGLSLMAGGCPESQCHCEFPVPGGVVKCSDCGNGICERGNLENYCSCSSDCGALSDTCGNGICDHENGEDEIFCASDCTVDTVSKSR